MGGYLIFVVSVSTLSAAILMKYFDSNFEDFDRRFKEMRICLKNIKSGFCDEYYIFSILKCYII